MQRGAPMTTLDRFKKRAPYSDSPAASRASSLVQKT
jgi:hypothetical protein